MTDSQADTGTEAGQTSAIGIYSFPKSGNTWMRHIVAAAAGRKLGDVAPGVYRNPLFEHQIRIGGVDRYFYKSHGKRELTQYKGEPFRNAGIIYLLRHPLDVFLSQLNYLSRNVAKADHFQIPCESVDSVIERGELDIFFSAFLAQGTLDPGFADAGSWFDNVSWWTAKAETDKRIVIVRYEDLLADPRQSLVPVANLIGVDLDTLAAGLDVAGKRTRADGLFFWKQTAGHYRELIPKEMIARFAKYHGALVNRVGYTLET